MKETLEEAAERFVAAKQFRTEEKDKTRLYSFIQGAKWQQKNSYNEKDLKDLLEWLTNEKSEFSIMYGNQDERFSSNDNDYTIDEILEIYKNQL
jgi:phenylalanyl-tRNA synthetase alpha subunit